MAFAKFRLFPMREDKTCSCSKPDCRSPGKHPLDIHSQLGTGEDWTEDGDPYGIATGLRSGVFVVDTDVCAPCAKYPLGKDGETSLKALGGLPPTYTVRTGSGTGYHYYFRVPEDFIVRDSTSYVGKDIDIRGEGGFVVGPGSPHESGGTYAVVDDRAPVDAPAWLLSKLRDHSVKRSSGTPDNGGEGISRGAEHPDYETRLDKAAVYLEGCDLSIKGQAGATAFFKVCLVLMRDLELPVDDAYELVQAVYNPRLEAAGTATWQGEKLRRKLREARDKGERPTGSEVAAFDAAIKAATARPAGPAAESYVNEDGEVIAVPAAVRGRQEATLSRGDEMELAERVQAAFPGMVYAEGGLYRYSPASGTYRVDPGCKEVKAFVGGMAGCDIMPEGGAKTVGRLKIQARTMDGVAKIVREQSADEPFFKDAPIGLACPNGFVAVTRAGVEVRPHCASHRARWAYDVPFDVDAEPPMWRSALLECFRDDSDRDQKVDLLQEFLGACLFGFATRYEKALILKGEGRNGKSKFLAVAEGVFPEDRRSTVSLEDMGNAECRKNLIGGLLNTVGDADKVTMRRTGILKQLISGDSTSARILYLGTVDFRPTAGHIINTNHDLKFTDQTFGLIRKIEIVEFNRTFAEGEGDPELDKKILGDPQERARILAWLAHGAARVLRQGGYTKPAGSAKAAEDFRKNNDNVEQFLWDCLGGGGPEKSLFAHQIHALYCAWAKASGEIGEKKNPFCKRISGKVDTHIQAGYTKYRVRLTAEGAHFEGLVTGALGFPG